MKTQTIIKGKGCLAKLPALLAQQGSSHVLLVSGRHLLKDNRFQQLLSEMPVKPELLHPADGVLDVDAIPAFDRLQTVVAIGGGKVMDFAKGIIHQQAKPVFFVAVPTTAGSGSEATPVAVFYRHKEKVSLDAPELLPDVAILDPALLDGLPLLQRAISGADALAQSIESVWSVKTSPESEVFALDALKTVWEFFPRFVQKKQDQPAEEMLWGAFLAGKAIAFTRTTGPHALSYYLTAHHNVPHGQAVALTLPLFFLYNDSEASAAQLEKIYRVLNVRSAGEACEVCRQVFAGCGLATSLSGLRLSQIDIGDWLASVNQQRFLNNPVPFDAEKLKALFQRYL